MTGKIKLPALEIFMTAVDAVEFSKFLKDQIESVKFITQYRWPDLNIPISDVLDIEIAKNIDFSIINTDILSIEDYKKKYVIHYPGANYDGAMVGEGLVRFSCSTMAGYAPGSLMNGRLTASYDVVKQPETDKFVKAVWKIFKKGAKKVYLINRETGQIADKPETRFFAWPDAAKKFNGENGHYLTNHAFAYFVAKDV
ncbi:hypothetical protein H3T61_06265 [Gilliamella sp. B14384H2]|uniref:hypothetical protein n=1 Tax=unclassified Gilliamella TaxID=2685620 RepID=UPI0018DBB996|nr:MULTISPECIES: hypothetical protein [unclassified Gilliamella]MBI0037826.1 hypothetical protein [Gilliamella sp. B14384G10]MBI0039821.1 hypothetical protein [Gilliamella sp. B14384G7]MBI0051661.1 hypothetical protein [Gilliamella sp. B14384G13]MBI0054113.1 hypothetical protein [Gilliamella sp. B14384H2]